MANRTILVVRILAQLPDNESAMRLAESIKERVSAYGNVQQVHAQQYWKIPEHFEASITLACEPFTTNDFISVLNDLGDGWIRIQNSDEEKSAVWKHPEGNFFVSTARWAVVECFPESAQAQ